MTYNMQKFLVYFNSFLTRKMLLDGSGFVSLLPKYETQVIQKPK